MDSEINAYRKKMSDFLMDVLVREIDSTYDTTRKDVQEYLKDALTDIKERDNDIDLTTEEGQRRMYREVVIGWLISMRKINRTIDSTHKLILQHYAYCLVQYMVTNPE